MAAGFPWQVTSSEAGTTVNVRASTPPQPTHPIKAANNPKQTFR
jgi:hypothetical protein